MLSIAEVLLPLVAVVLVIGPLWLMFRNGVNRANAKQRIMAQVAIFAGVFMIAVLVQLNQFAVFAEEAAADTAASNAAGLGYIAAAIAVAGSSLGAGLAVAKAAPAAIGAVSENGDNFGKAIIFVALGEGCAIYGLLISILIINNL